MYLNLFLRYLKTIDFYAFALRKNENNNNEIKYRFKKYVKFTLPFYRKLREIP